MNASWKALSPVAFITVIGSGGLLLTGIRYGAAAYQLVLSAAVAEGAPITRLTAVPMKVAAASPMAASLLLRMICPPGGVRGWTNYWTRPLMKSRREGRVRVLGGRKAAEYPIFVREWRRAGEPATDRNGEVSGRVRRRPDSRAPDRGSGGRTGKRRRRNGQAARAVPERCKLS